MSANCTRPLPWARVFPWRTTARAKARTGRWILAWLKHSGWEFFSAPECLNGHKEADPRLKDGHPRLKDGGSKTGNHGAHEPLATSGGEPKGVEVQHLGVLNMLAHHKAESVNQDQTKQCVIVASFIFDSSLREMSLPFWLLARACALQKITPGARSFASVPI